MPLQVLLSTLFIDFEFEDPDGNDFEVNNQLVAKIINAFYVKISNKKIFSTTIYGYSDFLCICKIIF